MGQHLTHILVAGSFRRILILSHLLLVGRNLILELAYCLPGVGQRIRLAIETFVAMTAHAAPLIEKIATQIQRLSPLRHAIFLVALLATRFGVLLLEHRPEPKLVKAMPFQFT